MRDTILIATLLFCLAGLTGSDALAQSMPANNSSEQLLVLTNGEVLRGRISRNGEKVILFTSQGSRLVLPAEQTEFVCNSLDEAYWGKLARVKASDVKGQTRLFHWCLNNGLVSHAQNQIEILLLANATAAEMEYLDRQLNVALMQRDSVRRREQAKVAAAENERLPKSDRLSKHPFKLTPVKIDDSIGIIHIDSASGDEVVFRPLPALNGQPNSLAIEIQSHHPIDETSNQSDRNLIRQVGYTEEVDDRPETISKVVGQDSNNTAKETLVDDRVMIPIHELERETKAMPDGALSHYRKRVERVLTNGCSAAKCHSADSRIMPLLQRSRSAPIPRRQSQRNLHNVLKYVDRTRPTESRLLLAATLPHAGLEKPILDQNSPHYGNLLKWLIMMSDNPREAAYEVMQLGQTHAVQNPTEPLTQDLTQPVSVKTKRESTEIQPVKPEPDGMMRNADANLSFPKTVGEIPKLDADSSSFTPVDPFDPEIFNRRFGKK